MKETLTTWQIAEALRRDEYGGWSYAGAEAMAEYLEQMEEDLGEEIELDVVAIRCDYSEYASLADFASDYGDDSLTAELAEIDDDEERDEAIREYINERGQLIEFAGGIIVSSF